MQDYLDNFCFVYVNNILVYTDKSFEQHREHVQKVILCLREAGLQLDINKCEFEVKQTKYLGFVINTKTSIQIDPNKVKAILEQEALNTATAIQSFLGFANFSCIFIKGYLDIAMLLTKLMHKNAEFSQLYNCQQAFNKIKRMFTTALILVQFDYNKETVLETDSLGQCIRGTLMQYNKDGLLRLCAFFLKKNVLVKCNYKIYNKEMLAIVQCLKEQDTELQSVPSFEVCINYKNLEYFITTQKLTKQQIRQSLILSCYNFTIAYILKKENVYANTLS